MLIAQSFYTAKMGCYVKNSINSNINPAFVAIDLFITKHEGEKATIYDVDWASLEFPQSTFRINVKPG